VALEHDRKSRGGGDGAPPATVPLNFSLPEQPLMPMYGRPLAVPETEVEKFSSVAVTPASGVTMLAGIGTMSL
jgi:hypothetical protein